MAISKVTYAGNTLIDLTGDTVTPENLLSGATAHAANGEEITGIVEDKKGELEAQIADLRSQIGSLKSDLANRKAYYAVNAGGVTVENAAIIDGVSLDLPSGNYVIFVGMNYITLEGYPRIVLYFDGTADNTVRTWLSNTVNEQNQLQTAFYVSKSSAFKVQVGSIGTGAKFTASEYIYLIAIKL